MNPEQTPQIPDDASELFESLSERDQERKRAIDIARKRADEASTKEERDHYKDLADYMSGVRSDLQGQFPEVFDD